MTWFFNVLTSVIQNKCQSSARRSERRAQLQVEALEDRLVMSTAAPDHAFPLATPGSPASVTHSTDSTGIHHTVNPERPVHGYKWRRPRPYAAGEGSATVLVEIKKSVVVSTAQDSHKAIALNDQPPHVVAAALAQVAETLPPSPVPPSPLMMVKN
jgi:hypothetical protein